MYDIIQSFGFWAWWSVFSGRIIPDNKVNKFVEMHDFGLSCMIHIQGMTLLLSVVVTQTVYEQTSVVYDKQKQGSSCTLCNHERAWKPNN
jgi:hypothetical protein